MNVFSKNKKKTHPTKKTTKNPVRFGKTTILRASWFCIGLLLLIFVAFSFLSPLIKDANKIDYFDYVSELRSNVLLAEKDGYLLRAYAVKKENPYSADGVRREMTSRAEIYFIPPSGDSSASVQFTIGGKVHGGEMSYDNVKEEYFFSVTADLTDVKTLDVYLTYGKEEFTLTAKTVKTEQTLSPKAILEKLKENEPSVFEELTNEHGFVGEINLRLISDDSPYYYVGLIEKGGKTHAYLLTADTGRVLAKRET